MSPDWIPGTLFVAALVAFAAWVIAEVRQQLKSKYEALSPHDRMALHATIQRLREAQEALDDVKSKEKSIHYLREMMLSTAQAARLILDGDATVKQEHE